MSNSTFGRRLNPSRRLRGPLLAAKGKRETVVFAHNPSTIGPDQKLLIRFQDIGEDEVLVPGSMRLAFNITLKSTDPNRTVVNNLGRAIIKTMSVKIGSKELTSFSECDIFGCYADLWLTPGERAKAVYRGLDTSANQNVTKLRVGAADGDETEIGDKAVANVYKNRFVVPLDFELFNGNIPFYHHGLGDQLAYILTFNSYDAVILADGDPKASYEITDLSLEYEKVHNVDLAKKIRDQYIHGLVIPYDRVEFHHSEPKHKEEPKWQFHFKMLARSLKGVLILFKEPTASYARNPEVFYNPQITNVNVSIGGQHDQLFGSGGMRPYHQWDEIRKLFGGGYKQQHPEAAMIAKDLEMCSVTQEDYLTSKYGLYLDMRISDDDKAHGSGRAIEGDGDTIAITISKEVGPKGPVDAYIFTLVDAQVNIGDGRYNSAIW